MLSQKRWFVKSSLTGRDPMESWHCLSNFHIRLWLKTTHTNISISFIFKKKKTRNTGSSCLLSSNGCQLHGSGSGKPAYQQRDKNQGNSITEIYLILKSAVLVFLESDGLMWIELMAWRFINNLPHRHFSLCSKTGFSKSCSNGRIWKHGLQ